MAFSNSPPRIIITEQPKQRGMRFRYECEGRSAGSIPGENTTGDKKTWPQCMIANYNGKAVVRVSLVSNNKTPRPHPHSLVGKDCDKGICKVNVGPETHMQATFSNLGIQCVKRKDVKSSVKDRISMGVDPFESSNNHDDGNSADIDLNIVRLCFEAFLLNEYGQMTVALAPVVSNAIYDKKATNSALLRISRYDRSRGSCRGGDEMFILCDKVQKEDISVVFTEPGTNWEALGEFSPPDVHRQVAIVLRTPPYRTQHLEKETAEVVFYLRRMSDGQCSETKKYTYLAEQHGVKNRNRKHWEDQSPVKTELKKRLLDKQPPGQIKQEVFSSWSPTWSQPEVTSMYTSALPSFSTQQTSFDSQPSYAFTIFRDTTSNEEDLTEIIKNDNVLDEITSPPDYLSPPSDFGVTAPSATPVVTDLDGLTSSLRNISIEPMEAINKDIANYQPQQYIDMEQASPYTPFATNPPVTYQQNQPVYNQALAFGMPPNSNTTNPTNTFANPQLNIDTSVNDSLHLSDINMSIGVDGENNNSSFLNQLIENTTTGVNPPN